MTEFVETASVNKNGALQLAARRQDRLFVVFIHGSVREPWDFSVLSLPGLTRQSITRSAFSEG
jgi:hypothetical protein